MKDIVKELEDPVIQDHVPADIKCLAGATVLWLIGEMKKVLSGQYQPATDTNGKSESAAMPANCDPFKDVMHFLISDDPAQGLKAKFVKHHDNPDYAEGIVALEETFANALKAVGWKLQRPVKVVHYEEF